MFGCPFLHLNSSRTVVPSLSGTRDWFRGEKFFHGPGVGVGNGFGLTQACYTYCAPYF